MKPKPTPQPWVLKEDGEGWPMIGIPSENPLFNLLDVIVCHTDSDQGDGRWLERAQAQAWANAQYIMDAIALMENRKHNPEQGDLFA